MIKTVGQPSDDRWIEAFRDDFGMIHANKAKESTDTPVAPPIKKTKTSNVYTTSKRTLPSQQAWRSEKVFGRIVNFFEQSIFLLKKVWPTRPPKVDQRLMASLHGERVAALYPLGMAPLSSVLKYTINFLETQKGEDRPPKEVIRTLKQTAKWSSVLENASTLSSHPKRQEHLVKLSKGISKAITKLPEGSSCIIPGGWREAEGKHEALYQVTKNASGNYDVKILSRDPTVNPQSMLFVAGETKVYPETTFNEIKVDEVADAKWLQALLSLQMPIGGEKGNFLTRTFTQPEKTEVIASVTSLKQVFMPFVDRIDLQPKSIEKYEKTSQVGVQMKNLWMLIDILGLEAKNKMLPSEKRRLQLKVNSLFQFYAVVKKDLANNRTNQILLEEGILTISKSISLMHAQGKLTEVEVVVINRELAIIENALKKATQAKTKKSKKDVFKLRSHLNRLSFKTGKFKTASLKKQWTAPVSKSTEVSQPKTLEPLSPKMQTAKVVALEVPVLPRITTENAHAVLQKLKADCQDLAANDRDYELQERIINLFNTLEFPGIAKLGYEEVSPTLFKYEDKDVKWSTLSEKELEECGVALSQLSGLLSDSIKKTGTMSKEKIFWLIKAGFFQEYLARLNYKNSGLTNSMTETYKLTFWRYVFSTGRNKDADPGRVYSARELKFLKEEMSTFNEHFYSYYLFGHHHVYKSKKNYNYTLEKFYNYVETSVHRPTRIKMSPQLIEMEKAIEKFQSFFYVPILDKNPHKHRYGRDDYIGGYSWEKEYEFKSFEEAPSPFDLTKTNLNSLLIGAGVGEQMARNEPLNILFAEKKKTDAEIFEKETKKKRLLKIAESQKERKKIEQEISKEDLADLLVFLGETSVNEMMGIIRQKPYLLSFSSVRSLLEREQFSNKSLLSQISLKTDQGEELPLAYHLNNWVKEQIELFKHQGKIHETLFMMNLALSLTNLKEASPALATYVNFPDYTPDLRNWAYASLDPTKEEYQYRHTIWNNLLLHYENLEELSGDQIADLLKGSLIISTAPVELYENDPMVNTRVAEIKMKWRKPIEQFLSKPENDSLVQHTLNSICQFSKIPIPSTKWEGKFPAYQAGSFAINVMDGTIKNTSGDWITSSIPLEVQKNLNPDFSRKEILRAIADSSIIDKKEIYRYTDQMNRPTLVVKTSEKQSNGYKEFEVPTGKGKTTKIWFESISRDTLFGKDVKKNPLTIKLIKRLFKLKIEDLDRFKVSTENVPKLLDQPDYTYWINPKKNSQVLVLDSAGNLKYQVFFKKRRGRLVVENFMDLQEPTDKKVFRKIGFLPNKVDPIWKQLTLLDTPQNITVRKVGNRIERVDLNRYGLSFAEKEGKAVCTNPRLNGWILESNVETLKKGFKESIVLRHPTIPSQHRIIVPNLEIIPELPEINVKLLLNLLKTAFRGRLFSLNLKDPVSNWKLTFSSDKQEFWIFDINPTTKDFEEIERNSVSPYLYLAQVSLLHNQPETSLEMLLQMQRVKKWDQSDAASVSEFLNFLPEESPDGVALKLQCALIAKKLAPKECREDFDADIAKIYPEFAHHRNAITNSLRVDQKDEEACLKITEKLDPEWSKTHIPLLAQKKGEMRKMKVLQKETPFHATPPEVMHKIDRFSAKLLQDLVQRPTKSSLEFLGRDASHLGTDFKEIYQLAAKRDIKEQKFHELDLTLNVSMPLQEIKEDYLKTLHNFLTRVLDIRKAGKDVPFPEFPTIIDPETYKSESSTVVSEQMKKDVKNLEQFLIKLEEVVLEAEKSKVPLVPELEAVGTSEFDEALFLKDMQEATDSMESSGSIEELSLKQLKEALFKKVPEKKSFTIKDTGQSLYSSSELGKFFKAATTKEPIPNLDLTDLQKSSEKSHREAANELGEEIQIARAEMESAPVVEFIHGEKSKAALEKDLLAKKEEWAIKQKEAHQAVMDLILEKSTPVHILQARAKLIKNVDLELLLKHFLQEDLEALKPDLPEGISLDELRTKLGNYLLYATETQRYDAALTEIKTLDVKRGKVDPITISNFYSQLTATRQYDPQKDPHLLIFEYMTNLLLREVQLKMIQDFLQDPDCVRQAITGAGKTTVILVLLALMQADGSNVVTVNFPKHLIQENLIDLESKLGKIFQRSVYSVQFDLSTPLELDNGESLFKQMYEDLIRTSLQKGVVVSTLESQQALEQKWIHLMDTQSKLSADQIDPLEKQHLKFLTKIMMLKREREYTILDEFDKALNQREERHAQLGTLIPIPKHLWETSLDLYELLLQDPELGLLNNTQGNTLTDVQRNSILNKVADQVANQWGVLKGLSPAQVKEVKSYIKGENEDILAKIAHWSPEELDAITLHKDEFYTFLPLTLAKTCQVRYMRSDDNVHTVPCLASDIPRNSSEFDQMLEKLNYMIQDYYQTGIREAMVHQWIMQKKRLAEAGVLNGIYKTLDESPEAKVFEKYFPGHKLGNLLPSQIPDLVQKLNQDPKRVRHFLEDALAKLKVSAGKISCDANNLVSMSAHTAGASATLGSLHALPPSLHTEGAADKGATGKMVLTMLKKSQNPDGTLPPMKRYDAGHPEAIVPEALKQDPDIQIVIDGSGVAAFHGLLPGLPAKQLLENQPPETRVKGIIFGGKGNRLEVETKQGAVRLDAAGLKPSELGGFFSEEKARGADFKMMPGGQALIMTSDRQLFEEALQTAGRLRRPDQKLKYAAAQNDPLKDVADLVKTSLKNSVERNADNANRGAKKRLRNELRNAMIEDLLRLAQTEGLGAMLDRYQEFSFENILISKSSNDYSVPGSYFAAHAHISRMDKDPGAELNHLKANYTQIAEDLGLTKAVEAYKKQTYSDEFLSHLPKKVFAADTPALDQEVEIEVEVEVEIEVEVELETEVEKSLLPRRYDYRAGFPEKPLLEILPGADAKLEFTENFFPAYQNSKKDPKKELVRKPNDDMQNPAHYVAVSLDAGKIDSVLLMDILDFESGRTDPELNFYDMRLKRFITGPFGQPGAAIPDGIKPELNKLTAQIRFFNGEYDSYSKEELAELRIWLKKLKDTSPDFDMENHFKKVILKYKSAALENYPFSPLAVLFKILNV